MGWQSAMWEGQEYWYFALPTPPRRVVPPWRQLSQVSGRPRAAQPAGRPKRPGRAGHSRPRNGSRIVGSGGAPWSPPGRPPPTGSGLTPRGEGTGRKVWQAERQGEGQSPYPEAGEQGGLQDTGEERRQLIAVLRAIKALEKGECGLEVLDPLRRQAEALQGELARMEPPAKRLHDAEHRQAWARQAAERAQRAFDDAAALAQQLHAKLQAAYDEQARADKGLVEARASCKVETPTPTTTQTQSTSTFQPTVYTQSPFMARPQPQVPLHWTEQPHAQVREAEEALASEELAMVSLNTASPREGEFRQATIAAWSYRQQQEVGLQPIVPWEPHQPHSQERSPIWLDA